MPTWCPWLETCWSGTRFVYLRLSSTSTVPLESWSIYLNSQIYWVVIWKVYHGMGVGSEKPNNLDIPSIWMDFVGNYCSVNHQSYVAISSQLDRLSLHCNPYGPFGSSFWVHDSSTLCFLIFRAIFQNELSLKIRTFLSQVVHVDFSWISLDCLCSWLQYLRKVIEMSRTNI